MSIFKRLFSSTKVRSNDELIKIAEQLNIELKSIREQWFFVLVNESKKIISKFNEISPILEKGNVIDCILIGYQLCCIMGFTMREKYISQKRFIEFDELIVDKICRDKIDKCNLYRERYLDYEGDIHEIETAVTEDLIQQINNKYNIDMTEFPSGIKNSVSPIGIISQAAVATIFGDEKTARGLKSRIKLK